MSVSDEDTLDGIPLVTGISQLLQNLGARRGTVCINQDKAIHVFNCIDTSGYKSGKCG